MAISRQVMLYVLMVSTTCGQWNSYTNPAVPKTDMQMAVGVWNGNAFLVGGYNTITRRSVIEFDGDQFDDKGNDALPRDTWGYGDYYAQIANNLFMIEPTGVSLNVFNMAVTINQFTSDFATIPSDVNEQSCLTADNERLLLFVVGGSSGSTLDTVQILDIAQMLWTNGIPMQTARRQHSCIIDPVSKKLYAIAGTNGTDLNSVEFIDTLIMDKWEDVEPGLTDKAVLTRSIIHEQIIYVVGGYYYDTTGHWLDTVHLIDPTQNSITLSPDRLSYGVWCVALCVMNNVLHVFGGNDNYGYTNKWMKYAIPSATNNPTQVPTNKPTSTPTKKPTDNPIPSPTLIPTKNPILAPTDNPIPAPTYIPTTDAPTTYSPTSVPTTSAPTTSAPTTTYAPTYAPTTSAPTTSTPTTYVPTTSAPTTENPTSAAPTTANPTYVPTRNPITFIPTNNPIPAPTDAPTTSVPTTSVPTTSVPTTSMPTISAPTSAAPTTFTSTTATPTSENPTFTPTTSQATTAAPSNTENPSSAPTTFAAPTTANPTTFAPTSYVPTTDPTSLPTASQPTHVATDNPTSIPTEMTVTPGFPTEAPSDVSLQPTISPTRSLSWNTTIFPTTFPPNVSPTTQNPTTSSPSTSPTKCEDNESLQNNDCTDNGCISEPFLDFILSFSVCNKHPFNGNRYGLWKAIVDCLCDLAENGKDYTYHLHGGTNNNCDFNVVKYGMESLDVTEAISADCDSYGYRFLFGIEGCGDCVEIAQTVNMMSKMTQIERIGVISECANWFAKKADTIGFGEIEAFKFNIKEELGTKCDMMTAGVYSKFCKTYMFATISMSVLFCVFFV